MGGGSSSSSDSHVLKIGLKFGQKTYFEDDEEPKSSSQVGLVLPSPSPAPKKVRTGAGSGSGSQQPRCQVEGCNLDLSDAKTYYSRHKVCGAHSKTAKVVVNGLEQRFCQQCSRFHQLPEFDQGKRSCRRRLAGHNERRRKPTSGTLLSNRYGNLPNSIFGNSVNSGGFLMDFSSGSRGRVVNWPNTRAPTLTEKFPPLPWQSNLDNPPPYINQHVPPGGCFNGVQESNCALSLLSNHASASRNQPLTHDYYVNTNAGPHMLQPQPPTGTIVHGHVHGPANTHGHGHFPTGWGFDTNEAHLGLGQVPQSSSYSGELGLGQQGGRRYDSSADHIDWSL